MAYDIVNSIRSKSTIYVTGTGATTIELNQLRANPTTETVSAAAITTVISSTNGTWTVKRGGASGTTVLELWGDHNINFAQQDITIANSSSSNIYVTNSGANGTLILQVTKTASYNVDPFTGQTI